MKATSQQSQAESPTEGKSNVNDSDDERWEDKLVIDLDSTMSNTEGKNKTTTASPGAVDSETPHGKAKDQSNAANSKAGRAENAALGKPKGKRNGQKKGNENKANEANSKVSGKGVKGEKEKTSAGKPGRKKKDKSSPTIVKSEASEACTDDPYNFEPSNEKISGTAMGKTNGKSKSNKSCKDAQTEYDWRSVATITEPENLGPCEPGTQVCLEGIVWQETNNGILVVNITWKGKTYMGTLLDATKHDWSPPSCDSPTGDFEGRTPKGRGKRSRVPLSDTFKDINERKLRKEMRKQSGQNQNRPKSPISPKLETGKRKGRTSEGDPSEPTTKRGRGNNSHSHSPPTLIECPEPNCNKKYKQMNGLKYHQRNAHRDTSPHVPSETTSEEQEKLDLPSSPVETSKPATAPVNNAKDSAPNVTEILTGTTRSSSPIRNNTTSVITPTTNSTNNTTTSPSSSVPVATITPQVMKPASAITEAHDQNRNPANSSQMTNSNNRGPPKLVSKPNINNSAMAPISTITSPGTYNSTLKPIQPKPTILGEVTPNPGLHELMDQKKLKRKRSISKEDLGNPTYGTIDGQKSLSGSMHKFDTEHRGLLSNGGMINPVTDPSNILQSPAYSDISDEGELKNAAGRRDLLNRGTISDHNSHSQSVYPIATVSPQKNVPLPEKDGKKPFNRQTPSHSPIPSRTQLEKQKQMQYLQPQSQPWPMNSPESLQMMTMQNSSNKDKANRAVSPKPASMKPSSNRASDERLEVLKESMAMKGSTLLPRNFPVSPNTSNTGDFSMYQEQKQRDSDFDHHNLLKNISPANKVPSMASNKSTDGRYDKTTAGSSPMAQSGSFPSLMSTALFQQHLSAMQMHNLAGSAMLGRGFPPGMPLPGQFPYPQIGNMASDSKDNRNSVSPSFTSSHKPNHKIHELESVQSSKSPRPAANDRQLPSKNLPISSQSSTLHPAALLESYNAGLMFHHPK